MQSCFLAVDPVTWPGVWGVCFSPGSLQILHFLYLDVTSDSSRRGLKRQRRGGENWDIGGGRGGYKICIHYSWELFWCFLALLRSFTISFFLHVSLWILSWACVPALILNWERLITVSPSGFHHHNLYNDFIQTTLRAWTLKVHRFICFLFWSYSCNERTSLWLILNAQLFKTT